MKKTIYIVKPKNGDGQSEIPSCITEILNQYKKQIKIEEINYPIDSSESHLLIILKVINGDEKIKNYIFVPKYYDTNMIPSKYDMIVKSIVNGSLKGHYLTDKEALEKFITDYVL